MVHYFACLATSLDGKIGPANVSQYTRISSDEDIAHLMRLRDRADAIVMGGKTFRAYPRRHRSHLPEHRPRHAIVTRGTNMLESVPPDAPLFDEHPAVPVVVFTVELPSEEQRRSYPAHVEWVGISNDPEAQVRTMSQTLVQKGCESALVEGGGEIVSIFMRAQALQEIYLTICPLFLGGESSPDLLSDIGFSVENAPKASIVDFKRVEDELYLRLELTYAPKPVAH